MTRTVEASPRAAQRQVGQDPRLLREGPLEWLSNLRRTLPLHATPEPLLHLERLLAQTETSARASDQPALSSRPGQEGPRFAQHPRLSSLPPALASALTEASQHGPTLLDGIELTFAPLEWLVASRQHCLDALTPAPLLLEQLLLQLGIGISIHAGRVERYPLLVDALPSWLPRRGDHAAAVALLEALAPGRVAPFVESEALTRRSHDSPRRGLRFGRFISSAEATPAAAVESTHSVALDLSLELLPVLAEPADDSDEAIPTLEALEAPPEASAVYTCGEILACRSLEWYAHRLSPDAPSTEEVQPPILKGGLATTSDAWITRFRLAPEDVRVRLPDGISVLAPLLRLLPTWTCARLRQGGQRAEASEPASTAASSDAATRSGDSQTAPGGHA